MWTFNTTSSLIISSNMQTSPTRKVFSVANADQPAYNLHDERWYIPS